MRTGRDLFERAMRLLQYTDDHGRLDGAQDAALFKRGLSLVNQIYSDLWFCERGNQPFCELTTLEQPLALSSRCLHDVAPYGVAMLLAQTESDGDSQQLMASLYNQKRAALYRPLRRQDVLPCGRDGGWL